MKRTYIIFFILASVVLLGSRLLSGCRPDEIGDVSFTQLDIPAGFPAPSYQFQDNPLSTEGIQLGRRLFYDGRLSKDGNFPCASCHQQIAGFGTYEHDRSHGYNDSHTLRNAPSLFNLAWQSYFHWDGEFSSLKEEASQPITGHIEMAETFEGVIDKLQADATYREQFRKVFRSEMIRPEYILKALAQFTGSLISANSKYDRVKRGADVFTATEAAGYTLFQAHCNTCHTEPLFTDHSIRNIGLPLDNFLVDYGRMRITGDRADSLKFKTPSLRNVNISSNYMHDGRFNTLMQCVNHYRNNVQASATLDPLLQGGIPLTDAQANQLVAFMRTLTDSSFITNPAYARP